MTNNKVTHQLHLHPRYPLYYILVYDDVQVLHHWRPKEVALRNKSCGIRVSRIAVARLVIGDGKTFSATRHYRKICIAH